MDLKNLRVLHLRKGHESTAALVGWLNELLGHAFRVETCQRQLWILPDRALTGVSEAVTRAIALCKTASGADLFSGVDAYRFMLRFASGLESEVKGETDVFGQIKSAWATYSNEAEGAWRNALAPWINRLFEDTKEIRARHLQNVGGSSYGSLVRRLLKQEGARPGDSVLVIGAGQIAASVLPWLGGYQLLLANRTQATAEGLVATVARDHGIEVEVVASEFVGLERAKHLVLCVPADEVADGARVLHWKAGDNRGAVVHLGVQLQEAGPAWSALSVGFYPLNALFQLQKQADAARDAQIERAYHACDERALLRGMGGSTSLPHGWEDLAAFSI